MAKSNFIVRGGADFSAIPKAMAKTQTQLKGFQSNIGKSMSGIGKSVNAAVIAFGAIGLGVLVKDSTKMAMGVESSLDNISRNMKGSSAEFNKWVMNNSRALGMGKAEAFKYGSTFSNLLGSFISNSKETASETENLMKAAAVISSKTGRAYDDTANRIRSGMLGSTEAIEDLGIYTQVSMLESTNAFKKFANGKSWAQLDFRLQQQIRLAAILEQTYERYGDTLADTTQTRQAQFLASLKNIQLNIGKAFLPIYNFVLPALTALTNKLETVTNVFASFTESLFGRAKVSPVVEQTEDQTTAVGDLGDATETAGKQAKKALASFDQLNTLGNDTSGGSSSTKTPATVNPVGNNEIDNANTSLDKLKANLKNIYDNWGGKELIVKVSVGLDYLMTTISSALTSLKNAFTPILVQVGATLKSNTSQLQQIGQNIGNTVGESIRIELSNFADVTDVIAKGFEEFVTNNKSNIKNFIDTSLTNLITTANNISGAISELTNKFGKLRDEFWATSKTDIVKTLEDLYNTGYKLVSPVLSGLTQAWKNASEQMKKFVDTPGVQIYLNGLKDVLSNFIVPALKTFAERCSKIADILNPILTPALNKLGDAFNYCFGEWLNRVSEVLGFFGKLSSKLSEIGTFFTTVPKKFDNFASTISNFATGVTKSFSSLSSNMLSSFKIPLEAIRSLVNKFIGLWNNISFELPKITLPSALGGGTVGGSKFGVPNIKTLPALKNGGITNGPMVAMVGDNVGGKEVISPLDDLKDMIAGSVSNAMKSNNNTNNSPTTLIFKVGESELGRVVIKAINDLQRQSGETLLLI